MYMGDPWISYSETERQGAETHGQIESRVRPHGDGSQVQVSPCRCTFLLPSPLMPGEVAPHPQARGPGWHFPHNVPNDCGTWLLRGCYTPGPPATGARPGREPARACQPGRRASPCTDALGPIRRLLWVCRLGSVPTQTGPETCRARDSSRGAVHPFPSS